MGNAYPPPSGGYRPWNSLPSAESGWMTGRAVPGPYSSPLSPARRYFPGGYWIAPAISIALILVQLVYQLFSPSESERCGAPTGCMAGALWDASVIAVGLVAFFAFLPAWILSLVFAILGMGKHKSVVLWQKILMWSIVGLGAVAIVVFCVVGVTLTRNW